jgi:GH25 family lysozyme M1 (1,4-beta-N-acetylmuramidase)
LKQTVAAVKAAGKEVGIYASHYMWTGIFGGVDNCAAFTGVPLWYPHYDHSQSFADFQAFGSWKAPTVKQYAGTTNMCGGSVDLNYKN